jgi:hypothetical protein
MSAAARSEKFSPEPEDLIGIPLDYAPEFCDNQHAAAPPKERFTEGGFEEL